MDDPGPEVLDAARRGDAAALETVLRTLHPRVWAIARRLLGNEADAADATQEALISIVRGLPGFDGRSAFGTWAHRVATNACLDELRRRRRRPVADEDPDEHGPDPGDPIGSTEQRIDLEAALGELSDEHRVVLVLREVGGHDYAEIAELLDLPIGTVRSRLARARRHLVQLLDAGNSPGVPNVEPTV